MTITLSITFTPQVSLNHRICYKETTDATYTCTIVTGMVAGTPYTANINVTVPSGTESCDPITFEGYVQPTCEPEASNLNKTPFPNLTYTPDNPCLFWEAICKVGILQVDVIDPGSTYTPSSSFNPTVTGDGAGAVVTCYTDAFGAINYCDVITPGTGYTTASISTTGDGELDISLADCNEKYVFGEDCSGELVPVWGTSPDGKVLPGQVITMCHPKSLPDPVGDITWEVNDRPDLCCYECEQTNLSVPELQFGIYNYQYIDCETQKTVQDSYVYPPDEVPPPVPILIICYVKGSLITDPGLNTSTPVPCTII